MNSENFDKKANDLGITSHVFPLGKNTCKASGQNKDTSCNDADCGCFQDKLKEFVEYQIPQYYLDSTFDLGIPLSSPYGKAIFKDAIHSDYMECYYTISQQIEHQTENTCGTTSLIAALNSLRIDPARATMYEQWRWHHLGSLACCTRVLQNPNMTLFQFSCLAICNDVLAFPMHVDDDWALEKLRAWVKLATSRSDVVMVANYGRQSMHQIGIGHFLPIAGYNESQDLVLLVEISKHKYPASWLPLCHLRDAMNARDNNRGVDHRGFALLTRPDYDPANKLLEPSLLLRLDEFAGRVDPRLKSFMELWNKWLDTKVPVSSSIQEILCKTIRVFISSILQQQQHDSKPTVSFSMLDLTLIHFRCDRYNGKSSVVARCKKPHCSVACYNELFCHQLKQLDIFRAAKSCADLLTDDERRLIVDLIVCDLKDIDEATSFAKSVENIRDSLMPTLAMSLKREKLRNDHNIIDDNTDNTSKHKDAKPVHDPITNGDQITEAPFCPGYVEFFPEHILTFFFLSWPFDKEKIDSVSALRKYVQNNTTFDSHKEHCDAFQVINFLFEELKSENMSRESKRADSEFVKDINTVMVKAENGTLCDVKVSNALNAWTKAQLQKSKTFNVLHHHVKAMKRKLNVILQYHQLL